MLSKKLKPFKVSKKPLHTSICKCFVPFANIQARGIGNELPKHEDNYGPGGEVVDLNVKKLQEPPAESNFQKNQQLRVCGMDFQNPINWNLVAMKGPFKSDSKLPSIVTAQNWHSQDTDLINSVAMST